MRVTVEIDLHSTDNDYIDSQHADLMRIRFTDAMVELSDRLDASGVVHTLRMQEDGDLMWYELDPYEVTWMEVER